MNNADKLENTFEFLWNNAPAPFNPDYKPYAKEVRKLVTDSMENDGYYDKHTRKQCAAEWRKRYDALMAKFEA